MISRGSTPDEVSTESIWGSMMAVQHRSSVPLVSIITPCYNGAAHVGRLIESVLDQTYSNIEFILVNDGSTDATEDVVGRYLGRLNSALTRFVYVKQVNAGLGAAINAGLRHVTGDYLCWPDADDYLEPDSVSQRVRVLETCPEYAVVTSDAYIRHEGDVETIVGRVSEGFTSNEEPQQFLRLLRADSIFTPGCHMARMSAFDETHPDRRIFPARRGQNWQMLLPLYYRHPRFYLDLPLYNYIVHESSMSRGDQTVEMKIRRLREHRQIRQETLNSIAMEPSERAWYEGENQRIYLRGLVAVHLGAGDARGATEAFRRVSIGYRVPMRERLRLHTRLAALRLGQASGMAGERAALTFPLDTSVGGQPATSPGTTSVLVTTYNGEKFIEAQLDSIRNQTKPVDQVLICDDGSTDGTVDRVHRFLAAHKPVGWSIVVNQSNLGVAANVLTHIAQLHGEFVFLADQDDVWEPHKVDVMRRHLAENPQVSLVVSRSSLIDGEGHAISSRVTRRQVASGGGSSKSQRPHVQELRFRDFIGYSTVPLHAMCARGSVLREIADAGGFPQLSRSLGADWYIGMWSSVLGDCVWLRDRLVRRRVHGSNISLGRLRKKTALAGTPEKRLLMLREAKNAHQSLLSNAILSPFLSPRQRLEVERMCGFLEARIEFASGPTFTKAGWLLTRTHLYRQSSGALIRGLRMFVADVLYAYKINWRLPGRTRRR